MVDGNSRACPHCGRDDGAEARHAHGPHRAEVQQGQQQVATRERLAKAYMAAASAVLSSESFEQIARKLFDLATDLIGATSGYVALLSEDGHENEVLFLEAGGLPCTVDPELPMPIRGLRAQAYHSMKVVFDNGFSTSEWVDFMPEGHVALDNVMFAPLNAGGKTVGLMGLANKPTGFSNGDAEVAAVFGELAAIALQMTRDAELRRDVMKKLERSNDELLVMTEHLQQHDRAKGRFIAHMSHELKTPLNAIKGYVSLLRDNVGGTLGDKQQRWVAAVEKQAHHLLVA